MDVQHDSSNRIVETSCVVFVEDASDLDLSFWTPWSTKILCKCITARKCPCRLTKKDCGVGCMLDLFESTQEQAERLTSHIKAIVWTSTMVSVVNGRENTSGDPEERIRPMDALDLIDSSLAFFEPTAEIFKFVRTRSSPQMYFDQLHHRFLRLGCPSCGHFLVFSAFPV